MCVFNSLIKDYKKLKDKTSSNEDIAHLILLNAATEGLIKIILFFNSPSTFLLIERQNRTMSKLRKDLIIHLKNLKTNKDKLSKIKNILELITELRNNFIHFPLYYEDDYRFEQYYFAIIDYLIKRENLQNLVDKETKEIIKQILKENEFSI